MPDVRQPDLKNGAADPELYQAYVAGDAAAANAAGVTLMVDQGCF